MYIAGHALRIVRKARLIYVGGYLLAGRSGSGAKSATPNILLDKLIGFFTFNMAKCAFCAGFALLMALGSNGL